MKTNALIGSNLSAAAGGVATPARDGRTLYPRPGAIRDACVLHEPLRIGWTFFAGSQRWTRRSERILPLGEIRGVSTPN